VEKDLQVTTNHLDELSKHKLVSKANGGFGKMAEALAHGPEGVRAVGAKKLPNSG